MILIASCLPFSIFPFERFRSRKARAKIDVDASFPRKRKLPCWRILHGRIKMGKFALVVYLDMRFCLRTVNYTCKLSMLIEHKYLRTLNYGLVFYFCCQQMHVRTLSKHRASLAVYQQESIMMAWYLLLKGTQTQTVPRNFGKNVNCLVYFYTALKIKYDLLIWAQGCTPVCSQIWIVYLRSDSAESNQAWGWKCESQTQTPSW